MHRNQQRVRPSSPNRNRGYATRNTIRSLNPFHRRAQSKPTADRQVKPYQTLSEPLVTLHVSRAQAEESRQAFELLVTSQIGFRIAESQDGSVSAEFAGQQQQGLEGVRILAQGLSEFQNALFAPGSAIDQTLDRIHDPHIQSRAQSELKDQFKAADKEMQRILAAPDIPT